MTKRYRLAMVTVLALVWSTTNCNLAPSLGTSARATRIADELRDLACSGNTEALGRLTARAEQGNRAAQYALATMYDAGNGLAADPARAAKWHRKAADHGDPYAQFIVGLMFFNGEGVDKDAALAVKWFRKSAEQGFERAQSILGSMYASGEGVSRNLVLAHMWLSLGVGDLKTLEESMTPAQITQAQKLSVDLRSLQTRNLKGEPSPGFRAVMPEFQGTGVLDIQSDLKGPLTAPPER